LDESDPDDKRDWEDLKQPMLDLMLLFYNREDLTPATLIDGLTPVLDTLYDWKLAGDLTAQSILNFMVD
jgi:hypothetical protein